MELTTKQWRAGCVALQIYIIVVLTIHDCITGYLKMIMEVYAHLDEEKEAVQERLNNAIAL